MPLGAAHHGLDHFPADRADCREQRLGHLQLEGLLAVRVGHVASLEPARTPRDAGDRLGDAATGAGFRRADLLAQVTKAFAEAGGQCGQVGLHQGHHCSPG